MKEIICQGQKIIIRRYFRTRFLRLRVNRRGEVILSIPFLCPQRTALAFIEAHQDWIKDQQAHSKKHLYFQDGQTISLLGQSLQIQHIPNARFATHIEGEKLCVSGDSSFLNRRVTDFVKHQTETYIQDKAPRLAAQIGQRVNHISLKDTTSRWGSCSGKKNLNFCWRLGLAPLFVLDYIIAHEVAHLAEMNHGPRFWRLVSELTDNRSTAEIWLRRHGSTLR